MQIEELESQRLRMVADAVSEVDPKAIQAKIDDLDKSILRVEEETAVVWPMKKGDWEKRMTELKAAIAAAQEAPERVMLENQLLQMAKHKEAEQKLFERNQQTLKGLFQKRRDWVVRIQQAKSKQNAQQLIEDEIQVLRDIRKQVLRDRLMLEMGLEEKAK